MIKIEDNIYAIERVRKADSFFMRAIGLMFKHRYPEQYGGLLLTPSKSIHTLFMFFEIDVLFLDKNLKVVRIYRSMKPWRLTRFSFRTKNILELPSTIIPLDLQVGDSLEVSYV